MKTSAPDHLLWIAFKGLVLFMATASFLSAATDVAESNRFLLDTRWAGETTVTGRVLSRESGLPLTGVTIELVQGERMTQTGPAGTFILRNLEIESGVFLRVSLDAFTGAEIPVLFEGKQTLVDVGDIFLGPPPPPGTPIVESLTPDLKGMLLRGWGLEMKVVARVNWNGSTPGSVDFRANGKLVESIGGSVPRSEYWAEFAVDEWFTSSFQAGANTFSVTARSQNGVTSEPKEFSVTLLPVPAALRLFLSDPANARRRGDQLILKLKFPPDPISERMELPLLGSFGGKFQADGEFAYTISSGGWELDIGGHDSRVTILLGHFEAGAGMYALGRGTATSSGGIHLDGLSLGVTFSIKGSFDLAKISAIDIVGPGLTTSMSRIPGVGKALNVISIVLEFAPNLSGSAQFRILPVFDFESAELTGRLALNAAYKPDLKFVRLKLYVGGEPRITFQVPGPFFKEVGFRAYAGLEAKAWSLSYKLEYVFVDVTYPRAGQGQLLMGLHDFENGYRLDAAGNATATWQPAERTWRQGGAERFLPAEPQAEQRLASASTEATAALDVFRGMGRAATRGAIYSPPETFAAHSIASDPDLPAQAELPLLENVYPDAEPALAGRGDTLMLLYVRDNGADNVIQFTEIAWTSFDGTTWSPPAALAAGDARGQFNPQVAFDGKGNAIAVFEQIKDPAFEGFDLDDLAARMEIVWSRWDPVNREWSTPQALSNNAFLDFHPQLAGPLDNGDLLLVWTQNEANQLQGSGAPGDPANSRILFARWNSAVGLWSPPAVLVDQLAGELSGSLAAGGSKAVYLWTREMEADDEFRYAELFFRAYDAVAATWGPEVRHTEDPAGDPVPDRNAKIAVDPQGNVYALWQRADDLVMDINFSRSPHVVRTGSDTLGFADFALTIGPGGNVLLIWQEMNEYGPNAHFRVYDSVSETWSLDTLLSKDEDIESAFSPVWDAMGNLTIAYLNTAMMREFLEVETRSGEIIGVEGVPQPGQVDLLVAKRALVKDLAIDAEGFVAEGTDFLPGDQITITTTVRNTGNVAIGNPVLRLSITAEEEEEQIIHEVTLSGWLRAGDSAQIVHQWTVPHPAIARTLHAIVDPANVVTEFDEENNEQWIHLNGTDLALEFISGNVLNDGSVRIVARVTNRGAPASPPTRMELWRLENPGMAPLHSVDVSLLEPGRSVELALELPAGSHAEGDTAYRLVVDAENASADIDLSNNEVRFALTLWIDEDGNGLPDSWEWQHFGGIGVDPAADPDGDGFTNYEEFLAGTDPNDPASFLQVGEMHVRQGATGAPDMFTISWASVPGRLYTVVRSYGLDEWHVVADDVPAVPPLNTYHDLPDLSQPAIFYRILVR